MMQLKEIYQPIEKELKEIERVLEVSLKQSKNQSILRMGNFLLESPRKRIRPALVLLSAKASHIKSPANHRAVVSIAAAVELIHIASLIHDDVIDHASLRHNKPTINSKFGQDVSVALGDYLYSVAFELISACGNMDVLQCISSATKAMCEGELAQVCERDNLDLLKQRYLLIVKKKTASLFVACCYAGSLLSDSPSAVQNALKEYGLNFGIAFQIIDDYLDLVAEKNKLGKIPGQDLRTGEITLPLLNLLESVPSSERKELKLLLILRQDKEVLPRIKSKFYSSQATARTKKTVLDYIALAKEKLKILSGSVYKESLLKLADFVVERGF